MRRFLALFTSISLVIFVCLFAACGGGSNSNSGTNSASGSGSGSSGSGSGSGGASSGTGSSGGSSGSGSSSGGGSSSSGSGSSGSGSTGSGGAGGSGGSGSGSGTSTSSVSFAYTASGSEIRAYAVSSNGSLTPAPGSPYSSSTAQNRNIVTNGSNLYAIDPSQTNLNIFSVDKSTGSLNLAGTTSAITGDPNTGDIALGLSLDHTGSSLYADVAIPSEEGGVNVFTVGSGSTAHQIQYVQGQVSAPSPFVFSTNNQYAYYFECSSRDEGVFGYTRGSDGTLSAPRDFFNSLAKPTGSPGEAFCPEGLAVSAKGYLAILWFPFAIGSSGQVGNESYIMTYSINSDGTLTGVSNSQVKTASSSTNQVALNFDPTGSLLGVAGDGGVQTYSLNGNGVLIPAGPPQNAGTKFQNLAWDNTNHVFASTSNQLYVYNSAIGVLTAASGSPYAGDPELAVLPLQ